jgi:hypothetical protein
MRLYIVLTGEAKCGVSTANSQLKQEHSPSPCLAARALMEWEVPAGNQNRCRLVICLAEALLRQHPKEGRPLPGIRKGFRAPAPCCGLTCMLC